MGCIGLGLIGAASLEAVHLQHRCRTVDVTDSLASHLPKDKDGDGVVISNAHLMAGQFFSFPYACEADATPLRSGIDLSAQAWTHFEFEVFTLAGKLDVKQNLAILRVLDPK